MLSVNHEFLLRDATSSDALLLCKWWNDGEVMAHAGFPFGLGKTEEDVKAQLESQTNHCFIMEKNQIPIGEMNYKKVDDHIAKIGIKICVTAEQGKGYGTIFLKMLIHYLFENLGFTKIILDTNLHNRRAQHVYEKLGFKKIRVNIKSWKDQLGVWQSSVDYELNSVDVKY